MYNVVLVDDEKLFLQSLSISIDWNSYGFDIAAMFEDAKSALVYLRENPVNLLITDIMMPGMDGLSFIKEFRIFNQEATIILLSGASDFEYARKAIRLGVNSYLLKPVNSDELLLNLMDIKEMLDEKYNNASSVTSFDPYYKEVVEKIKKNVIINYRTVTLEQIAIDIKMSTNYISKIFKKVTGQTFSDYLIEVKMTNAMKLLSNNELKIYEIAYMIGYDNPKNFTRAFKKYWNKSPWDYRENGFKEN